VIGVDTATRQGDMHGLDHHLLLYFAESFVFDPPTREGSGVMVSVTPARMMAYTSRMEDLPPLLGGTWIYDMYENPNVP
jgi:hypothetical protein